MDLFRYAEHSKDKKLKKMARHELKELGGEKRAEAYEKKIKSKTLKSRK
jgi:hypothetical protein